MVAGLTAGAALFAWRGERTARLALEDQLHEQVVSRVAEGLDTLDGRSRRLLAFDRAALTSGILDPGATPEVLRFFRQQLEDFEDVGYVGLLHLAEPLSGVAVRRTELGSRVEEVAFQAAASRFEPFPGRLRYSFRLDEMGRRRGGIRELDFNPPWDDDLARAMTAGREGDWRALFDWAMGEGAPSIHVQKVTAAGGRPLALLGVAPNFEALDLRGFRGVAVLDPSGRVVARSADAPEASPRLRRSLAKLSQAPGPRSRAPAHTGSDTVRGTPRWLGIGGRTVRITPWWRPVGPLTADESQTRERGAGGPASSWGGAAYQPSEPGLWIATLR
ncbi:MAG: hypothetical protein MI919_40470 [Holophagales bacterium]|nr:hypothetical protein [Holophagales bacterium]